MTIWLSDIQKGDGPLYKRVADGIERDIFSGKLYPGEKLPTHRDLADRLQINVTTVTKGYKEAEKRGLLAATVGRGTYVSSDVGTNSSMVSHKAQAPGMHELGLVNPLYQFDPDLSDGLQKLHRRCDISTLLQYSDPAGLTGHRQVGAKWAKRFGIDADPEDVMICAGAQHALTCVLSNLFSPGDRVATDFLTYPGMKTLSAMLGLRLVPVEMDASGMSAESLDRVCRRNDIKGIYLMPGVHNPTTITMPESRRKDVAEIVAKHNLIAIEDDAYDLTRPGVISPLSALVPGNSIYIAGISKALAAGLRVAFVVMPPRFRKAVYEAILNTIWMAPPLNVALVAQWIKDGTVDRVLELKRTEAAKRFALASELLSEYVIHGIPTGFFLWLSLPEPWTGALFERRMKEQHVNVFGAEKFTVGDAAAPAAARISLTGTKNLDELTISLQRIKRVLAVGTHFTDMVVM